MTPGEIIILGLLSIGAGGLVGGFLIALYSAFREGSGMPPRVYYPPDPPRSFRGDLVFTFLAGPFECIVPGLVGAFVLALLFPGINPWMPFSLGILSIPAIAVYRTIRRRNHKEQP